MYNNDNIVETILHITRNDTDKLKCTSHYSTGVTFPHEECSYFYENDILQTKGSFFYMYNDWGHYFT